jgi:hypothetical protein
MRVMQLQYVRLIISVLLIRVSSVVSAEDLMIDRVTLHLERRTYQLNHCINVIRNYCESPQGYKAPRGIVFDTQWCPIWRGKVASEPEIVQFPPVEDASKATGYYTTQELSAKTRLLMQLNYIITALEQLINYINDNTPSEAEVNDFIKSLIKDKEDPFIKAICYDTANEKITVTLRDDNSLIEPVLRGAQITYEKTAEETNTPAGTSSIDETPTVLKFGIPVIIKPYFLDALYCMNTLTTACQDRQQCQLTAEWQWLEKEWSTAEWCPVWCTYVMPPP